MLTVRQLMRSHPLTLEPDESLRAAAELLTSAGVTGAPVTSGGSVIGVVSLTDILAFEADQPGVPTYRSDRTGALEEEDRDAPEVVEEPGSRWFVEMWEDAGADVVSRIAEPEAPEWDALDAHAVSEVMSRAVISVPPDADVREAADLMERRHVHRLLVLEDDQLAGILSALDLVRAVARGLLVPRDDADRAGAATGGDESERG